MSWFQPGSLEPLYKFEILGLLTSLAVYNGLTLPFSFPRAFYGHLLGRPPTALTDIEDGWPRLAKGLRDLRDWPKNDVEEVFSRQFVYSVPLFGTTLDVDMAKPQDGFSRRRQKPLHRSVKEQFGKNGAVPEESRGANTALSEGTVSQITNHKELGQTSEKVPTNSAPELNERHFSDSSRLPYDQGEASHEYNFPSNLPRGNTNPEQEPMMVTNENREEYIRKYIAHLTDYSIRDQRIAFERGFFTCISRKSITLFTPSQLKALIEGLPDIDVNGLERVTKYEGGFHPKHPTIRHFWAVVRKWSQENIRKLLEFVTASDRLPTGGVGRVDFAIQKNGLGDGERLPTSMTCFGKLLLPEYDSEEMLRRGLEIAVENSKGFGQF